MAFFERKKIRNAYLRVMKQSGSPEYIARGAAIGLFTGLFFPMGLQTPFAILFAFIFRAGKVTAWLFTLVTNPYTVPFLYPVQCYVGSLFYGERLTLSRIKFIFKDFFQDMSFGSLLDLSEDIMIPFFIGGFIFALIASAAGYFAVYGMVLRFRKRSKNKLLKKLSLAASRPEGEDVEADEENEDNET